MKHDAITLHAGVETERKSLDGDQIGVGTFVPQFRHLKDGESAHLCCYIDYAVEQAIKEQL